MSAVGQLVPLLCPCGDPVGGPPCTPERPCSYAEGLPPERWPPRLRFMFPCRLIPVHEVQRMVLPSLAVDWDPARLGITRSGMWYALRGLQAPALPSFAVGKYGGIFWITRGRKLRPWHLRFWDVRYWPARFRGWWNGDDLREREEAERRAAERDCIAEPFFPDSDEWVTVEPGEELRERLLADFRTPPGPLSVWSDAALYGTSFETVAGERIDPRDVEPA